MRTEQLSGLPVLSIQMDRAKMARYGLNAIDVQDAVAISVGGRTSGLIYEGDRRFELQVRLPEQLRGDIEVLKRLPISLPASNIMAAGGATPAVAGPPAYITLGEVANFELVQGPNQVSRENGKRRAVVTANVRGRDLGSFVEEAEALVAEKGADSIRLLGDMGRAIRAVDFSRSAPPDCDPRGAWIDLYSALYHVPKFSAMGC